MDSGTRRKVRQRPSEGPKRPLRAWVPEHGLPSILDMRVELQDMTDILMGRVDPPIRNGVMTLMEVANTCLARACELEALIHAGELDGTIKKGGPYSKFRTGELRSFKELFKAANELGSRRLTQAQMRDHHHKDY